MAKKSSGSRQELRMTTSNSHDFSETALEAVVLKQRGNNNCALFKVGADDELKSLLRFDLASIPSGTAVDEATLRLYYKGRSNGNDLTVGAYRLLASWVDSQATWTQRLMGANWGVPGLGSGSDYASAGGGATVTPTASATPARLWLPLILR